MWKCSRSIALRSLRIEKLPEWLRDINIGVYAWDLQELISGQKQAAISSNLQTTDKQREATLSFLSLVMLARPCCFLSWIWRDSWFLTLEVWQWPAFVSLVSNDFPNFPFTEKCVSQLYWTLYCFEFFKSLQPKCWELFTHVLQDLLLRIPLNPFFHLLFQKVFVQQISKSSTA